MKKLVFIAILAIGCFTACETDPIQQTDDTSVDFTGRNSFNDYPNNQMVVQYDAGLSEADKQLLRDQYDVENYKTCECADPTLELWIFARPGQGGGGVGGTIEEKVIVAKEEDDLEGAEFNPNFHHDGDKLQSPFGPSDVNTALNLVVPSNTNVTIAVLDTGVDYNYFGFTAPFLYNAGASGNNCSVNGMDDYYGWDFVNEDNDPYDDYGHGTIITELINNTLEAEGVAHQILPIKAFDANGNGNYFDILCGFKYAVKHDDVNVVNMSFGWYHNEYELLERFVLEASADVLVTTSAGNDAIDNDQVPHYPSSYNSPNIVASAALSATQIGVSLAWFSNYGVESVDLAAPGEYLPFPLDPNETVWVSGTSYSNALIAAGAGEVYHPGMTVQELYTDLLNSAEYNPNLGMIQYSSFISN